MNKYKAIFLGLAVLTLFPSVSSADLLFPYVVDEKPQVILTDSVPIDGYFGLENYAHDYVNGYLHITYTYTHTTFKKSCCPFGNVPLVYITAEDPRTTSDPTIKNLIPFILFENEIPTGLYFIDLQFDATGYQVLIRRTSGIIFNYHEEPGIPPLKDTDWAALMNRNIMRTPPRNNSMAFTPLPIKEPPPPRTPVIIIPGIMGSYLNKEDGEEVWMNIPKMLLSISDSYLNELALQLNEEPSSLLSATDIIRKTGKEDFFDGLILSLINQGYIENTDLFVYPYDWRGDLKNQVKNLSNKIEEVKKNTKSNKVDIVAHSMGGLIVKNYMKEVDISSIDEFIDIGTPHLGSSKSFKILNYGDDLNASILFGLLGLNEDRVKFISQNMPSVYELLPSMGYGKYLYDMGDLDTNGVRGPLDYTETQEFMKNMGRNTALVGRAEVLHSEVDDVDPTSLGVKTYNIVGCGTPTLDKIFALNKEDSGGVEYNISFVNGDGTVPVKSAVSMPATKTYFLKNATHALMPSSSGVKEFIADLLNSTSSEYSGVSQYPGLSESIEGCDIPNGKIVSFHSPIDLHIYDTHGNHTGPNAQGDIEYNIEGVVYEVIDGNKFAFLPEGEEYSIHGEPTGTGTFNVRIENIVDGEIDSLSYWNELPITSSSTIEFNVGTEVPLTISNFPASAILTKDEASDLTRPITNLKLKGNDIGDDAFISSVQVSFMPTDDKSGVLKTEYSLNDGSNWLKYTEPFVVNDRGGVRLKYRSTDRAGNKETTQSKFINIIYPGNSGKKR